MKAKSVIKFILCFTLLLGGCVDDIPSKKSTKVKHKKESIYYLKKEGLTKDTLYILWEKQKIPYEYFYPTEKQEYYDNTPYYSEEDKGTIFQLSQSQYVIFENGSVFDKLKIKDLQAYKTNTIGEIKKLDEKWRDKNELILKKDPLSMTFYQGGGNRNIMYVTYLIKIDENKKKFTIYPVSWYYPPEIQM